MNTKTYCPAPWIGLNILPGEARPCCQWDGAGENISNISILTDNDVSNLFVDVRKDMLQGNNISGCAQCYAAEQVGAKSRRQELIEEYGTPTDIRTKVLDVSFDNVCNLKCRGCCTYSSHLWQNDEIEIYGRTFVDKKYLENNLTLELDYLEHVNVSGGEPFLSKKFKDFADKMLEENEIEKLNLSITTNATVSPPPNIYRLMCEARHLSLCLSIDGIGDLNRYFRHGADFEQCIQHINKFKELKEIRKNKSTYLQIHTTVSIYNVNLIKEIEDFFNTNYNEFDTTHRILYWPEQLCIKNIPNDLKEKIRPIVESYGEKYIDILNELNNEGKDIFDHFINFHNKLDSLRNESLENINPLLFDYITNYRPGMTDSKLYFLTQIRG